MKPKEGNNYFWVWPLVFLCLWYILLRAQNPGLMSDDSGEMAAAAYSLGLPHPPAYPFFNLLAHLFSLLPIGTVAFRLNLFSSALALCSLVFILDTCRRLDRWGTRPQSKPNQRSTEVLLVMMGIIFISCRSIFAQCLSAKGCIYLLTLLLLSVVVWIRAHPSSSRLSPPALLGVVFLWALGMANHWQTQILWLPFLLLWFHRAKGIQTVKTAVYVLSVSLVGLSLYLYLPLRAALGIQPCWGNPVTANGFYWVISRQLVRGQESWIQPVFFYIHSIQWIFQTLIFYWLPGFSLLALGGAAVLWRKNKEFFYFMLILFLPVLAAVAMVHEERNQYLVPVYLISVSGAMVILGFNGAAWLTGRLPKNKKLPWVFMAVGTAVSAGWLYRVQGLEDKSLYTLAEDFGTNVLKGLPKNALLLADGDHYVMPIWYEQDVEGRRPDVVFEPSIFLYHNWGWTQLAKQAGDLREAIYSTPLFVGRMEALAHSFPRHPFFYSLGKEYLEKILEQMPGQWVPRGLAYEWTESRPRNQVIHDRVMAAIQSERLRGIKEFPDSSWTDPSTRQIYRYYAAQYYFTAQFLDKLSSKNPKTLK